ncbi:MAG: response regulator [Phycisphaerae bacterium]
MRFPGGSSVFNVVGVLAIALIGVVVFAGNFLWGGVAAFGIIVALLVYLLQRSCTLVELLMGRSVDPVDPNAGTAFSSSQATVIKRDMRLLLYVQRVSRRELDEPAMWQSVLRRLARHVGWPIGHIYVNDPDAGEFVSNRSWECLDGDEFQPFCQLSSSERYKAGRDLVGHAAATGEVVQYLLHTSDERDVDFEFRRRPAAMANGVRAFVAVPIVHDDVVSGVVELATNSSELLPPGRLAFLAVVGEQLGESLAHRRSLNHTRVEVRKAHRENRRKGELLANVSHDIRTPLNGILGMTDLALVSDLPPAQRTLFDTVHECTRSVLDFLNDILDFSKIEAGKLELERVPFDPIAVVDEVLLILGHSASSKNLVLSGDVANDVPALVTGDPTRLRQVLINLVGNAIKFTEEGEVLVRMMPEILREDNVTLSIEVRDTGVGISEDRLSRIFESYAQADESTTRHFGGTGLGLSICRKLVELQSGTIEVTSRPGLGSTFTVRLTYDLPDSSRLLTDSSLSGVYHADLSGQKILVADRNVSHREIVSRWIHEFGGEADSVGRADQVVERFEQAATNRSRFDVLILDDGVSDEGGLDLLRQIGELATACGTRVILVRSLNALHAQSPKGMEHALVVVRPLRRRALVSALQSMQQRRVAPDTLARTGLKGICARARILLAEDHWVSRMVTSRILHAIGCDVVEADSGRAVLEKFSAETFDLILMDLQLPLVDGLQACREIRAMDGGASVPIVALTAHDRDDVEASCEAAGMDGTLQKPLTVEDVASVLKRFAADTIESDDGESKLELASDVSNYATAELQPSALKPIDIERALSNLRGDRELLGEVLQSMLRSVPELIAKLDAAMKTGDASGVERAAHSIRGAASTVSAQVLQEHSMLIENLVKDGFSDELASEIESIGAAFAELQREVLRSGFDLDEADNRAATSGTSSSAADVTDETKNRLVVQDLQKQDVVESTEQPAVEEDGSTGGIGTTECDDVDAGVTPASTPHIVADIQQVAIAPDVVSGESLDPFGADLCVPEVQVEAREPTVLIVDDSPTNRTLCQSCLNNRGYRLLQACDGVEAYEMATSEPPDAIIMDIMMPRMDGLECTRRLRAHEATKDVPIIVLSAMNAEDDILRGFEAGANEYLAKPFRTAELALRVKSMVTLNQTRIELIHRNEAIAKSNEVRGEQARSLGILLELSFALSNATEVDEIARQTVVAAAELTGCRHLALLLPDDDVELLCPIALHGLEESAFPKGGVSVESAFFGETFRSGQTLAVESPEDLRSSSLGLLDAVTGEAAGGDRASEVVTSLVTEYPAVSKPLFSSKMMGVLFLCGRIGGRPFSSHDLEYLDVIANLAGSSISDLLHRRDRDSARDSIVLALATLAEWRDTDTGQHLDRVTEYAMILAQDLMARCEFEDELNQGFIEDLRRAMPLHDIGKVAIPDSILRKPGRLTDDEMDQMKTHTDYGAKAIRHIRDQAPGVAFLGMAEDIARCHHERFDGGGYPSGLAGEHIPLSARIASVADVYDALTTKRSYKDAFSHEKASGIILSESGSQFDPAVIAAFRRCEVQFQELAARMQDAEAAVPGAPPPLPGKSTDQGKTSSGANCAEGATASST